MKKRLKPRVQRLTQLTHQPPTPASSHPILPSYTNQHRSFQIYTLISATLLSLNSAIKLGTVRFVDNYQHPVARVSITSHHHLGIKLIMVRILYLRWGGGVGGILISAGFVAVKMVLPQDKSFGCGRISAMSPIIGYYVHTVSIIKRNVGHAMSEACSFQ